MRLQASYFNPDRLLLCVRAMDVCVSRRSCAASGDGRRVADELYKSHQCIFTGRRRIRQLKGPPSQGPKGADACHALEVVRADANIPHPPSASPSVPLPSWDLSSRRTQIPYSASHTTSLSPSFCSRYTGHAATEGWLGTFPVLRCRPFRVKRAWKRQLDRAACPRTRHLEPLTPSWSSGRAGRRSTG